MRTYNVQMTGRMGEHNAYEVEAANIPAAKKLARELAKADQANGRPFQWTTWPNVSLVSRASA